jgi:uncharacterized XkdX family phage protein
MNIIDKIKKYYKIGKYKNAHIRVFVEKKIITSDQYKEITGEEYQ